MIRSTITRQILMLVTGAVLTTAATFVAMALYGPPPVAAPISAERLAETLRTGKARRDPIRSLVVTRSETLPAALAKGPRNSALERSLATMARLAPQDVIATGGGGHWPMRPGGGPKPPDATMQPAFVPGDFTAARRADGYWLVVRAGPDSSVRRWWILALFSATAVLLLVTFISWPVARRISRPLRALAVAARSAKAGIPWSPTLPGATDEVRDVADALAMFDARHRDHFRQQTAMLASIAHDLGTPLARLAFRAESLPEAQREAAMTDIEQMRRLITNGIALARGEVAVSERIDLCALVRRVASDAGLDESRITAPDEPMIVEGETVAIERLVQNLVENGERHGGGAYVTLRRAGAWASLALEDDGAGFPPQILAIVCDPFVRGTDGTEGSGLGLAIARAVAERHGGSLAVGNRPQGGARVEALLPIAA
jgi:signal transduction histidine kinase